MTIGFRVKKTWQRIEQDLINQAKVTAVANISDVMSRNNGAPASLRPMYTGKTLAGSALTVRCRPGDNLMLHKALEMAKPNDVIVVDAEGATDNAIMGELMLARAKKSQVAGVIIYGAIRDYAEISKQETPVFAVGISHRGPYKDGPGEIGFDIALGSMVISSGDLIVGDEDGIVSISKKDAKEILDLAKAKHEKETQQLKSTLKGDYDGRWIDEALKQKGCIFID